MNDSFGVSGIQRVCHLYTQCQRRRNIEILVGNVLSKGLTTEQLHHEKWMARRLTHVVNNANIRMIQRRSSARLALETFTRNFSRKGLRQDFDGYLAIQPRIPGPIHFAHTALTNRRDDFVRAETVAF